MASKYQHGTAEYKLEQAREHLDAALAAVEKMRVETITTKPLEVIKLKGGNTGNYPNSFVEWNQRWSYESFDPLKEEHIERSYKAAMDWHSVACKQLENDHAANLPIIENNLKVRKNIENFMILNGVPSSKSKSTLKRNKWVSETTLAGYLDDIEQYCKINDGYESLKQSLATFIRQTEEWKKDKLAKIAVIKKEKEKSDKELRKIAKAMELAAKWGVTYTNNEELIKGVEEIAEEKWIEENMVAGEEIDIKCCDCGTWVYPEHRCSCGNRRMELGVEGNFLDGYYSCPQPY